MDNFELRTGAVKPVGHRRKPVDSSPETTQTPQTVLSHGNLETVHGYTPGRRIRRIDMSPVEHKSLAGESRPLETPLNPAVERYQSARRRWSPFVRNRLVPIGGISAIVLAGAAAFVDLSAVTNTVQYKDIITAAAVGQSIDTTSRSVERDPLVDSASASADIEGQRYITKKTDILADASGESAVLAKLAKGDIVRVTGVVEGNWTQIVHKDLPRWVHSKSLSKDKPPLLAHEGEISYSPCRLGSWIEGRLKPDTIAVYRAVCERFPDITSYGGQANRGTHGNGNSLDIMVSGARGHDVADFLIARQRELGIQYLIYEQRILNFSTGSSWRKMANRGGATANHFDHVHVTTYGSAGSR